MASSPYIVTKGVVLRETETRDADKILTLLTAERGKLSVIARGVCRKGCKFAACAQPLAYSEWTLYKKGDWYYANEGATLELFNGLRTDLDAMALGFYLAELTEGVITEESPQQELLSLLLNGLYAISTLHKPLPLVKAAFELRLMCLAGYTPELGGCAECGRAEPNFDTLVRLLREDGETIRALYERNESALREREGLEKGKGFYAGSGLSTELSGHTEITENGIRYDVDYINGQKTGFFLDQKYNRQAVGRIAPGLRVLDCFTHTGAFALNAAKAGAAHVTAVDVSADAIRLAEANAARNDLSGNMDFVCADVFDLLTALAEKKRSDYDFIVLDPPAFTKSSATVKNASRGYKEINLKAMRLLPRGGYLATCSCSHFMTDELFRTMLHDAAADAAVQLRQIRSGLFISI